MLLRNEAIGRLTDNPQFRTVEINGEQVAVAEFSIAVNQGTGENQNTEYINCVVWRRQAEVVRDNLAKGRKVYVAGKQKTRRYPVNKDGVEFNQTKVEWVLDTFEFCDSNNAGAQRGGQQEPGEQPGGEEEAPF